MPVVSMKKMLQEAGKNNYGIGQFNINNFEYAQAILQAAEKNRR